MYSVYFGPPSAPNIDIHAFLYLDPSVWHGAACQDVRAHCRLSVPDFANFNTKSKVVEF